MKVAIIGGHGKIALLLTELLARNGHEALNVIRNPEHAADIRAIGGTPVVIDVERAGPEELADRIADADAVVFAAGAGPGSTAERKLTVDRDGAIIAAQAAEAAGVRRFIVISAMRAEAFDPDSDDVFQVYLRAKSEADADIRARTYGLDWTIVRPGRLIDGPGSRSVAVGENLPGGEIPRADVAALLLELIEQRGALHRQFDVVGGDTPIPVAVTAISA